MIPTDGVRPGDASNRRTTSSTILRASAGFVLGLIDGFLTRPSGLMYVPSTRRKEMPWPSGPSSDRGAMARGLGKDSRRPS